MAFLVDFLELFPILFPISCSDIKSLGANILNTYGAIALNEFKETGSSGMVRTVRQVLTSATLPVTAKMTDYFGRSFMLSATIVFWIVGPIVFATSTGLGGYISGFLLYTMGHVAGNSE